MSSNHSFLVYKSSAGSGKTFTLAKSYLALSLNESAPDDYFKTILAITFTNKAANEMKERVLTSLRDFSIGNWGGKHGGLADVLCNELSVTKEQLQNKSLRVYTLMLHRYNDINISTIDRFVYRIVKIFAHDLNLPLNFEVRLDENLLLAESVYKLIQSAEDREDLFELLVKFAEDKTDEEKSWNIEGELIKFSGELIKEDSTRFLQQLKNFSIKDFEKVKGALLVQKKDFNTSLASIANKAITLINNQAIGIEDFFQGNKGIGAWFIKIKNTDWTALEFPNSYVTGAIEKNNFYSKNLPNNKKESIDSISEQLTEIYYELISFAQKHLPKLKIIDGLLSNLYRVTLLNEIDHFFTQLRKEENVVTISEFNKRINEIISSEPAPYIYERLGEKFHHFLIDEFQDTSVLQFQNFLPLIDNALGEQHQCLLVGDSKQAIYRWRGGAVEQMDTLPKLLDTENNSLILNRQNSLERNFELKILENNYRSKKEIVFFNNQFFGWAKTLLTQELQKIYHNQEQIPREDNGGGFVKFNFLEYSNNKEESTPKYLETLHNEIENLKNQQVDFCDIAILTRSNEELVLISEFLMHYNYPIVSSDSVLIKNNSQIKFIVAYLQWIVLPNSKLFFFNWFHAAHQMGLFNQSEKEKLYFDNSSPEKEYKKQLYKEYLYNKNFLQKNLIEIVEDIINSYITQQNPFNAYTLSFLDLVQEFVNNNQGSGIELFLEFWETKQNKLSINLPPGGNAIQLLTIHKSKGLEFPYVLLPFANWEIKQQSNTKWVNNYLTEIDLPCYLLNLNKNLKNTIYEHFYIEEKDKSLLDNINLLYVAFTRAENGLIVITEKEKPKETKEDVSIKYIHQILNQSFIKGLINDKGLYEVGDIIPSKQKEKTPAYLSINFYSHKLWNEKINIKAGKEYDEDWTTEYQIRFGEAFHLFIEYYFKTKNLEKSLLRITSFGYEVEIINRITDYFEQLNKHAEFSKWVNQYMVYAIEQDILIPNGTAYRPDLVLIKDRNTIVIDFKTGEKLNKHQEQVSNYKNLIKEITKHENVTGALVYVHQNSIEILNA